MRFALVDGAWHGAWLGADVTILNPVLDPEGRSSARAVQLLADALGP